jgi:ATP-dependent RNA helicase RhlE
MNFSSFNLHQQLADNIKVLGYQQPTPIQEKTIPLVLDGRDVMGSAQTGTGKTAAFALPILHRILKKLQRTAGPEVAGSKIVDSEVAVQEVAEQEMAEQEMAMPAPIYVMSLVLAPTRELAQQVEQSFIEYSQNTKVQTAILYGGGSMSVQIKAIKRGAHVVVATPGRLLDLLRQDVVDLSRLSSLVFDEADRMLDLGFKDEIDKIIAFAPKQRQTLLFSATFDDSIFKLSNKLLNDPKLVEVNQRNETAANVEQVLYAIDADRKRELISFLIGSKNWQQVLIFTRTKQTADELTKELIKDGIKAAAIHGDKSQGAREKALSGFKQQQVRALVATDVAARGLDIEDLPVVVNYELPYVAEDYVHRIGRTGRAGNDGLAISLMSADEAWLLEEIEAVLKTHLAQQWYPGYEPDLTKTNDNSRKNRPAAQRRRAKERAYGKTNAKTASNNRRRKR